MMITPTRSALLLALLIISSAYADNPVMCRLHQVVGRWEFTFGPLEGRREMFDERTTWGRGHPAKVHSFTKEDIENAKGTDPQLDVISKLQDMEPKSAHIVEKRVYEFTTGVDLYELDENNKRMEESGSYTLVLHEGWMGFIGDRAMNTFWRSDTEGTTGTISRCTETMVGWYHTMTPDSEERKPYQFGFEVDVEEGIDQTKEWGCFYAKKLDPTEEDLDESTFAHFKDGSPVVPNPDPKVQAAEDEYVKRAKQGLETWTVKGGTKMAASSRDVAAASPIPGSRIQCTGDDWTSWEQIKENFLNEDADPSNSGKLSEIDPELWALVQKDPEEVDLEELPKEINWADVKGYSFFPEIINQQCGDCFMLAFLRMFESKLMINSDGAVRVTLSNDHQKDCDPYHEGCDGGLPIDVAKFGWEYYFVEDKCYKDNKAKNKGEEGLKTWDPRNVEGCTKYGVETFYYVGGNYGLNSEFNMMKEVATNGPVTVVLKAPRFLGMYESGVIKQDYGKDPADVSKIEDHSYDYTEGKLQLGSDVNHKTLWEQGIEFEFVNHSVVCVGYGGEGDDRYWILANSWGKQFGEKGYFKIRRGHDDFAIESQALSVTPFIGKPFYDRKY